MTVNGRIAILRQRLGMSQRVFAERIGRSVGYVNRLENGKAEPTPAVLSDITVAFGLSSSWLKDGIGKLEAESVGDRFKQVRKARDYTQDELAGELYISRNSVGMIERGTVRPGDDIVDRLCDRLWIDKNWLLTGTGHMERTELTPFYELLKQDPKVRAHIRSFIDHLDKSASRMEESQEGQLVEQEDNKTTIAYVVHDADEARQFFQHYNIFYQEEMEDGEVKFRVKAPRAIDNERTMDVQARIRKARVPNSLCDHEFVFRDQDDNTIVTFSPYELEDVKKTWIEKSPYHFYGYGTTTFVIRC